MSSQSRQSCLVILSSAIEGVSAPSFMQVFTLAQSAFNLQLASPAGEGAEFVHQDDSSRRWLNEFKSKSYSKPVSFDAVEASHYAAILFPHAPGAVHDLAHNTTLAVLLEHFVQEKKPICAVGMGVAGLFSCISKDNSWRLKSYSMTATSVFEVARTPYFSTLSIIPEDYIREHGAKYNCSEVDAIHVVIDRHLITAQNPESAVTAVQNLILMCSQRLGKALVGPGDKPT